MLPHKVQMSKRQFRIGDLAQELNVKKFVIRFWEKEFDLKFDRSCGGQRFYTTEDLKIFLLIKDLLYRQGFTIVGAKKQLKELLSLNKHHDINVDDFIQTADQDLELQNSGNENAIADDSHNLVEPAVETLSMNADARDASVVPAHLAIPQQTSDEVHEELAFVDIVHDELVTPAKSVSCVSCHALLQQVEDVKQQLLTLKALLTK